MPMVEPEESNSDPRRFFLLQHFVFDTIHLTHVIASSIYIFFRYTLFLCSKVDGRPIKLHSDQAERNLSPAFQVPKMEGSSSPSKSCMDTACVRENPPPKTQRNKVQDSSILGT